MPDPLIGHLSFSCLKGWAASAFDYGTVRQLDEIALAAPQARQLRLASCGHSPRRDQPEKTVEAITDFLKNTG